jgi:hypothetical protein
MQRLFCNTEKRTFDVEHPVDLKDYKCPGCGSNQVEDVTKDFERMRDAAQKEKE